MTEEERRGRGGVSAERTSRSSPYREQREAIVGDGGFCTGGVRCDSQGAWACPASGAEAEAQNGLGDRFAGGG